MYIAEIIIAHAAANLSGVWQVQQAPAHDCSFHLFIYFILSFFKTWDRKDKLFYFKIILLAKECHASDGGFSSCLATTTAFPKKHLSTTANQKKKTVRCTVDTGGWLSFVSSGKCLNNTGFVWSLFPI